MKTIDEILGAARKFEGWADAFEESLNTAPQVLPDGVEERTRKVIAEMNRAGYTARQIGIAAIGLNQIIAEIMAEMTALGLLSEDQPEGDRE